MAWTTDLKQSINEITESFPGVQTEYIDPVLGRSLAEHLKSFWLLRQLHDYKPGYEAQKVCQYLEPGKFSEADWMAIAEVCGFKKSWAYKQMEIMEQE